MLSGLKTGILFNSGGVILKKTIGWISKTLFLVLLVTWMVFFVMDYFRAKDGVKPVICFSEETQTLKNGTYYKCNSLGYKYYEYQQSDKTTYGFEAMFYKSKIEKEIGV